jgi:hypothetical protein
MKSLTPIQVSIVLSLALFILSGFSNVMDSKQTSTKDQQVKKEVTATSKIAIFQKNWQIRIMLP